MRAYVETRGGMFDNVALYVWQDNEGTTWAPVVLDYAHVDPAARAEPFLTISTEAARAIYDALGEALGYPPLSPFIVERLNVETRRLDKLIDKIIQ